jgi:hypothetical protein
MEVNSKPTSPISVHRYKSAENIRVRLIVCR